MSNSRPRLIGRMAFDYSGYLGPIKEFKPKPAKFCGLVEDAAPPLTKPLPFTQFTPFTQPTNPKDPIMNRDAENPADDLKKKLLAYFEQQDATEAEKEDFVRFWDRIHKPKDQAMDRRRRAFHSATTESLSRMFPDYGRLSR